MTKPVGIREDGTLTPQAVTRIQTMASERKTLAFIASELGITKQQLMLLMEKNKGKNEVRLSYEAGRAVVEQSIVDAMYHEAMGVITEEVEESVETDEKTGEKIRVRTITKTRTVSKAAATTAIWFTKTQFGWSEKEAQGQPQSNVQIHLPASMTREQYYAMFGLTGPVPVAQVKEVAAKLLAAPPVKPK